MYSVEYLSSIHTLSIVVDYSGSVKDIQGLKVTDLNQLLLNTSSKEYVIDLPVKSDDLKISSINQLNDCLSIKFAIPSGNDKTQENTKPFVGSTDFWWSCSDLKKKTPINKNANEFHFNCIDCSAVLLNSTEYRFMDMPSEYWYELMDIWHCHKPHLDDLKHNTKYDGNLNPKKDTIILGSYYMLSNPDNMLLELCKEENLLYCGNCRKVLGEFENGNNKIFKWNILLEFEDKREIFPKYTYIYNLIMDKINLSATRKFKIKIESLNKWLYIWVVNVGIDVSVNGKVLQNSLKLLYHTDDDGKDSNFSNETVEELKVPDEMTIDFMEMLDKSNASLPLSNKQMMIADNQHNSANETLKSYYISYVSPHLN